MGYYRKSNPKNDTNTGVSRQTLEERAKKGLAPADLFDACDRGETVGVISIPCTGKDLAEVQEALGRALRRTDVITYEMRDEKVYAVKVFVLTKQAHLTAIERKVKVALGQRVVESEPLGNKEDVQRSELLQMALGLRPVDKSHAYVSNEFLQKDDILRYVGIVQAVKPSLLQELETVFARSFDKVDRYEFMQRKFGPRKDGGLLRSYDVMPCTSRQSTEQVGNRVGSGRFMVVLDKGVPVNYNREKKELQKFYN